MSRRIDVSRTTSLPIDTCAADALRKAAAVARRKRDREARRASGRPAGASGTTRKVTTAMQHAIDAVYFDLLAQKLEAKAYGMRALLGADSTPRVYHVQDLSEADLLAAAQQAARKVQDDKGLTHTL